MGTLIQDFKSGVRLLLGRPGFTLITVITLALGIGANTAIFSITDKLLIRSLAVEIWSVKMPTTIITQRKGFIFIPKRPRMRKLTSPPSG